MRPATERRRDSVTPYLIGWAHTQYDPRYLIFQEMTTECLDGTCDELSDCLEHTASTSSRRAAYSYTCACPDNKCGCNCQLEPQDAACPQEGINVIHDDVIKWKHFPRYWPFVGGIHRSPVNSQHKGQWRGALMFSLICVWINGWVNNREAGDLRRFLTHYDVIVMSWRWHWCVSSWSIRVQTIRNSDWRGSTFIVNLRVTILYSIRHFATWFYQYGTKAAETLCSIELI